MRPLNIIVVDDDPDFLEGVVLNLKLEGHNVDQARSGEEAIRKFREQDFDLTLMDIRMPGLNGVETFFEIRKLKPDTKVVMMSGYIVQHLIAEALKGGAVGVIEKPFSTDELIKKIDEVKPAGVVLVVDDDPDFAEGIEHQLSAAGYSVIVAKDGEEAIDKSASNHIDVLLLDLRLPGLSGMEAYLEIRKRGIARPTVIVTGYAELETENIAVLRELSVTDCLTKPIDSGELLRVVEDLIVA